MAPAVITEDHGRLLLPEQAVAARMEPPRRRESPVSRGHARPEAQWPYLVLCMSSTVSRQMRPARRPGSAFWGRHDVPPLDRKVRKDLRMERATGATESVRRPLGSSLPAHSLQPSLVRVQRQTPLHHRDGLQVPVEGPLQFGEQVTSGFLLSPPLDGRHAEGWSASPVDGSIPSGSTS